MTVESADPDASRAESYEKAIDLTERLWPLSSWMHSPVSARHIRTVRSSEADATRVESCEKATVLTQSLWPFSSWTQSPVPANRLADKPVYVLTSTRTFSGAEQFSYDLKMLKRAILVGETTGGAAHSGVFYRIDDHFGIGIPETKPINPFSKIDWAETGVEPDVKVKAAEALEAAVKLAQNKLQKK